MEKKDIKELSKHTLVPIQLIEKDGTILILEEDTKSSKDGLLGFDLVTNQFKVLKDTDPDTCKLILLAGKDCILKFVDDSKFIEVNITNYKEHSKGNLIKMNNRTYLMTEGRVIIT